MWHHIIKYHIQQEIINWGATYRATDYPGYIYTLNGKQSTISYSDYFTGYDTLDYKGYNSMYCKKRNDSYLEYYWWLASPSAGNSSGVCLVRGDGAALGGNGSGGRSASVR